MKRFYLLLISFLTLSLLVIAQVKMYVYQNNGNIVEVLASRVDSISFLFPDFPVNPDKPDDPVTPEDPDKPDTPVNPEDPDKPDTPVNPEDPEKPDTPVNPEDPDKPDTPVTPEKPEEPEEIEGMVKISAIRNRLEINTNDFTDFAGLYVKSFPSTEDATITYLWKYSADNNTWEDYSFGDGSTWDNIRPNKAGYYRCVLYYETSSNTLAFTSNTLQITSKSGQYISYSSKLPVILVRTSEDFPLYGSAEEMKAKRSVDVKILWNQNGGVVTDADVNKEDILYYDKKARMNYRGSSSLDNPKKSYAFVTGDKNCDPKKLGEVKTKKQEMFGSAANKDWVLYASYIDQTYMRNVLSYHQYSKMTGLWGPKCNYVELYVDGSYQGIYVFMDKITQDEKRVNISEDTGYILKFDKTDISDRNKTFITSHTGRLDVQNRDHAFEVDFPEDDDPAWQEKLSAIKNKVNELESSILNNDYEKLATIIDYETWADWFIINEFTKNVDAYRISCYFSLNSINEKIKATPIWDYELGFGNPRPFNADLNTRTLMVEDQSYYADAFPTPFWWVGKGTNCKGILGDCKFRELVKERWVKHIGENGALNATVLNNQIDSLSRVLSNSSQRTFVDVYELKSWISARTQGLNDIISSWETCNSVPEPTLYTIYFNANGGSGSMNSIELEEGKNFTIPSNPFTRTDYEFVGWNTKADGSGASYDAGESLTLTTDLTLYAQWKEIIKYYTLLFNANGGSGSMNSIELEEGKNFTIPSNPFSRTDYEFVGWNTKADGSGASYDAGESLTLTTDLTLYAQWKEVLKLETIVLSAEQIDDTNQVRVVAECSITPQRIVWFSKTENGTYREIEGENNNVLIITPEPSAYTYVKANMVTKSDEVVESLPIIISSTCSSIVFNDDFGTFERETDRASTPYVGPEYTYVGGCKALKEEGTYAVMVNPKFAGSSDMNGESYACDIYGDLWYRDIYDHTQGGKKNDRWGGLLMVNADAELVYSREVDVTPNTLMKYSAWVAYAANQNDDYGEILNSEITFVVRDARGRELVEMSLRLEESDEGWQKGEVVFNTEENSIVTIELYNYNRGGVGNDFVIDDISFTICDEQNIGIIKPTSISFNANGGVGNNTSDVINPLVYYLIPSNSFTREGYFFTGWNTKADGTGETLVVGQSIFIKEDLTLYAQWVKGVTVSFNANGGNGAMNSMLINPTKSFEISTNTFTNEDNFCKGWNTKADGTGIAYAGAQTISITESVTLYAQWEKLITTGIENGHGYVDLGLPSGLKWATMNVGAESPEDYGDYFAWGETESKSIYNWESYKWCDGSSDTMTKYCTSSSYGTVDNKTTLDLADDAANVNWGGDWRMPTEAEHLELRSECSWTWGTLNGVQGYKVTSKTNGNSIFLPASGYHSNLDLYLDGSNGFYWSSSLSTSTCYADHLRFYSDYVTSSSNYRYYGRSVRPVSYIKLSFSLMFSGNGGKGTMPTIKAKEDEQISIPSNTYTRLGYEFIGWNTKADGTGTSYAVGERLTLTTDLTLYAQWKENKISGTANGHDYVDLGLPSGTKWATCNVGADSPEEYGDYFAWGETTTKSSYDWSTYKWCNGDYDTQIKYCTNSRYGIVDNKTTLDLSDDAAYVNWGSSWRMPTKAEQDELSNTSYTTWTWTTQNGVKGYKVTSKTNGNSIFLPAAGYRGGSDLYSAGSNGSYWSSSLRTSDSSNAYNLNFGSGYVFSDYGYNRNLGQFVRPVMAK